VSAKLRGLETAPILARTGARLVFFDLPAGRTYFDEMAEQAISAGPIVVDMRAADPGEQCLGWGEFVDASAARPGYCIGLESESPCEVLFTSGSTGRPKGVVLGHTQVLKPHWDTGEIHQYLETDRVLITVSFSHNFGLNSGLLSSLMRGSTIVLTEQFTSKVLAGLIKRQAITLLAGPPSVISQLLNEEQKSPGSLASVNQVAMASSVIPSALIEQLLALGITSVATGYGLTECPLVTSTRRGDPPESVTTSSGRAAPGISIRLVAENGSPVADDEVGEVHVSGASVMLGYYNDEALTRQAIDEDGWLRTGDMARWVDGDYLRLVGREKDMFISQGFNVYPAEVENLFMQSGLLSNIAVVGKPSKLMGEEGAAYVVPADPESFTVAQLRKWAAANIASFKIPFRFITRASLPVNVSGKVDKLGL
jgi:acyl-CoA synthetase (AMP-forming)/AMP-acid ligase II